MTFQLSKHLFRRSGTVGTSFKAIAAAAAVLLCASQAPAVTNTLDHVPYTTGMWSVTDWFGFGSLSNALTRLTAVEATTNAVAETDPVAVPLVSVLSTGKVDVAVLLNVSNVLGSAVSVLDTGKVSQAQWVAGSNSFATAAQGAKASADADSVKQSIADAQTMINEVDAKLDDVGAMKQQAVKVKDAASSAYAEHAGTIQTVLHYAGEGVQLLKGLLSSN